MVRHARQHAGGQASCGGRPARADQLVVRADPAGGDDDGLRAHLERVHDVPRRRHAASGPVRPEHVTAHPGDPPVGHDQARDPVTEADVGQAARARVEQRAHEGLEDPRPGAPGDVEARHRVAVPARGVPASLGPLDEREPAHALAVQPRAHLACREVDEALGPGPAPAVRAVVGELCGAEPVGQRELGAVAHAEPPLLGRVDEEEPSEGPEGLTAQRRGVLGVEQQHAAAGPGQLGCRGEPGEAGADDHDVVGTHGGQPRPAGRTSRGRRSGVTRPGDASRVAGQEAVASRCAASEPPHARASASWASSMVARPFSPPSTPNA